MSLEDLSQVRLTTASRHLDDPRKAPASVTVIDADEIERNGWRTLAEVLRSVTGFYTAYDRAYTYAGMRGFLQSGDYNARFLVLIDGHRLNENVYDSALMGTEFPIDLNLVDRVEVVRGGGSSMYGTDAELAVVNVLTKRPRPQTTIESTGQADSFVGRGGEILASGQFAGASGILAGSIYRANGVQNLYFPEYDSPETNNGIAHNIDGMRYEHVFGSIRRGALRIEGLWGKRDKIVPNATYGTLFNDPNSRDIDTRAYLEATWNHDFSADTQFDLRVYYDAYRYYSTYPYAGSTPGSRLIEIDEAKADWIGIEAILGRRMGKHRLVAGTLNEFNVRLNQTNRYPGETPFLNDSRTPRLSALFGEAELNPNNLFSFNLGVRGDWYSESSGTFSPRLAAMYFPSKTTAAKYIFTRSFRAPDPYDQFYTDQRDVTEASPALHSEHIDSHLLLLEHKIGAHVQIAADGFLNHLRKPIEETYDPVAGQSHFANAPGDNARGFEIEGTAKVASGWSFRFSYAYAHTWQKSGGARVINSPEHLGKLNATAPVTRRAFLDAELLYNSSQPNYLQTRTPGYFLANTTFSTRPFAGGFQFSASCYNLLDRHYATPTGPESAQPATVQDGRTWRFRLTYRHSLERKWDKP